jgi:hypothetical protein
MGLFWFRSIAGMACIRGKAGLDSGENLGGVSWLKQSEFSMEILLMILSGKEGEGGSGIRA